MPGKLTMETNPTVNHGPIRLPLALPTNPLPKHTREEVALPAHKLAPKLVLVEEPVLLQPRHIADPRLEAEVAHQTQATLLVTTSSALNPSNKSKPTRLPPP